MRNGLTINFQVDDIDPFLNFYKNHLPFFVLNIQKTVGRGRALTLRMNDSVDVRLCFHEHYEGQSLLCANPPLKLEFAHKNMAKFKQHLVEAGIEFEELEVEVPWIWKISVLDPYGNTLTFSRAHD